MAQLPRFIESGCSDIISQSRRVFKRRSGYKNQRGSRQHIPLCQTASHVVVDGRFHLGKGKKEALVLLGVGGIYPRENIENAD